MKTCALFMMLFATTFTFAQTAAKTPAPQTLHADSDSVLIEELPNMKSDLAELRAMLNVLASQESTADIRTSAILQTNRKMWQVVIARLAELTQRLDAMEKQRAQEPRK
jgi:hypothetical protein